jgi:hypothetical protein
MLTSGNRPSAEHIPRRLEADGDGLSDKIGCPLLHSADIRHELPRARIRSRNYNFTTSENAGTENRRLPIVIVAAVSS